MSTEAPRALRADACPDPEQLAAFIDGTLAPAERTQVETHLLDCADCRDIVAGSVEVLHELDDKSQPVPIAVPAASPAPTPVVPMPVPRPQRVKWWVGAAAALAAAAAVVIVVGLRQPSPYYVPEMAQLIAVRADIRAIEPRLTGGFAYALPPPVTRGAPASRNLELTATAERVRGEIGQRVGPDVDAARGVSSLIAGDTDRAVESLELATSSGSPTAQMFSDLAAAYLERGRSDDLQRALSASDRSLRMNAILHEAAFNRALTLERLGRNADALQAWREYASRETNAQWVTEAQRHIERLSGRAS
jgi:anti-sigma factor RsiW